VGLKYNIKDAQKRDEAGRAKWRTMILQKTLVNTKLVKPEKVFHQSKELKGKEIRGVLCDANPLRPSNNAAVVVAFVESWFAHQITERAKHKRGLDLGELKIHQHLPPIIDCLKSEAFRERHKMIEQDSNQQVVCATYMKRPWVSLLKIEEGRKTTTPFTVDDGRLMNPAKALAQISLNGGQKFTPFKFLSRLERDAIPQNIKTQVNEETMES
jgi:hypothetical protein